MKALSDAKKPKLDVELYGILPSVIALGTFWLKPGWALVGLFGSVLGVTAATQFRSLIWTLPLIAFTTALSRSIWKEPLIEYWAAALLAPILVAKAENLRKRVTRAALLFLCLGILSHIYPPLSSVVVAVMAIGAVVSLVYCVRGRVDLMGAPWLYLDKSPNQLRLALYALAFLSFGGTTWSYLLTVMPSPGLAGLCHFGLTVLGLSALIHLLVTHVESSPEEVQFEKIRVVAEGAKETSAEVQRLTQEVEQLKTERENAQRQYDIEQVEAQARRERLQQQENARRQREFFALPWDSIISYLNQEPSVTIPGGARVETHNHILAGMRTLGESMYEPILLNRELTNEHIHIMGGTGRNKTSCGMIPIATQLIRFSEDAPLVYVDLKGELPCFHTIREEAERAGREFLFFTIEPGKSTYRFNPFWGIKQFSGNYNQLSQPIIDALGLHHGPGYGKTFFSRAHRARLMKVLRANPKLQNFKELRDALEKDKGSPSNSRRKLKNIDEDELVTALEGVFEYPQLFTTEEEEREHPEQIINFERVFDRNQIVYFYLPSPPQSMSAQEIGKLVLFNLFLAGVKRTESGRPKQIYLFVDEFQRLMGENIKLFWQQARSYSISTIIANHSIAELMSSQTNLWNEVLVNARVSLHFGSPDEEEIRLLSFASGETTGELGSKSQGTANSEGGSVSYSSGSAGAESTSITPVITFPAETVTTTKGSTSSSTEGHSRHWSITNSAETATHEYVRPVLRPHDIQAAFADPEQFILWVRFDSRSSHPFQGRPIIARSLYTMPKHVWEKRRRALWPRLPGNGVVSAQEYVESKQVTEEKKIEMIRKLDALESESGRNG